MALVVGIEACAPAADRSDSDSLTRVHLFEGATMGTTFSVTVVSDALAAVRVVSLQAAVESALADVDQRMSTYREDSELSRFNALRTADPFPVSHDILSVFQHARAISQVTGGAFDVTVGPMVDAWGFGPPGEPATFPTDVEIERLRGQVGYERLEIDPQHSTLRKTDPMLAADLSALAKGYGVDRVADTLVAEGLTSFLIEVGGEVRALGRSERGDAWRVGIERPMPGPSAVHRLVRLERGALATSGDYRNYYEIGDHHISHTIDPRTGRPVSHDLASVSVVAALCVRADAIATALEVLGPDEGFSLAVEQGWAALFIGRRADGTLYERETPAFAALQ